MDQTPYQSPSSPPPPPQNMQSGHRKMGDDAGMRVLLPVGRSGWAIAAGYLGLFAVTLILAPLALGVSIYAIFDIKKSEGTERVKHGMGRAIFGLVMGLAGTAGLIAFLLTAM